MIAEGLDLAVALVRSVAATDTMLLLRGPADPGAGNEGVTLEPLQVVVILGLIVLLVLLAVLVIWRMRRTRSK